MKTKNYLIVLAIFLNLQLTEAQQFAFQSIVNGNDTGLICSSTDPDKALGKMVKNNLEEYVFVSKATVTGADIYTVAFTDSKNGWAIGMIESCSVNCGVIFHTSDGGESWELQYRSGTDLKLKTFGFNNSKNGWANGTRNVGEKYFDTTLVTNDGGQTWLETSKSMAQLSTEAVALNTGLSKD